MAHRGSSGLPLLSARERPAGPSTATELRVWDHFHRISELHLHRFGLDFAGERGPDLRGVSGQTASWGTPQAKQRPIDSRRLEKLCAASTLTAPGGAHIWPVHDPGSHPILSSACV